ncbi:MAG: T9SS type A sorting domain-containing protein [Saprospiraceae bacterium]
MIDILPESYFSESVQIFDITGREVYQSVEKANQIDVPSATWAKGIYFYKVRLADAIITSGKIVKN